MALNGIYIVEADTSKDYLQSPSSNKDYIICGPEFGLKNVGNKALIKREIYGGNFDRRNFKNHLCECMCHLILSHALQISMFG